MSEKVAYRFSLDSKRFGDVIELLNSFPKPLRGECIATILRYYRDKMQSVQISEIPVLQEAMRHEKVENERTKNNIVESNSPRPSKQKKEEVEEIEDLRSIFLNTFR